jgi:adrenodoxin-NADP+ reductase
MLTITKVISRLLTPQSRHFSSHALTDPPYHFCVVGSGPAGLYTVDRLLKRFRDSAKVDIIEALPSPFGLVRSGVAPDHPETKAVINHFTDLCQDPRVSFFGNVTLQPSSVDIDTTDTISLSDLRPLYHAIILACGAQGDRTLLANKIKCTTTTTTTTSNRSIISARDFVWWYNSHPGGTFLSPLLDLSHTRSVAIVGMGNVALDCARILLKSPEQLATTDIGQRALTQLRSSSVTDVHIIGRRGPAQALFTPKELRELLALEDVRIKVHPEGALTAEQMSVGCVGEVKASRVKKRALEVLIKAVKEKTGGRKALHFHFYRNPVDVVVTVVPESESESESERSSNSSSSSSSSLSSSSDHTTTNNNIKGVVLQPTKLIYPTDDQHSGGPKAVPNEDEPIEVLPAQLVLESIGYRPVPIYGAPFDTHHHVVPNTLGQVVHNNSTNKQSPECVPGLFVCGWLKRGPSGIIGTNLMDAEQTVDTIVRVAAAAAADDDDGGSGDNNSGGLPEPKGEKGLKELLNERGIQWVTFGDWLKLDAEEQERGKRKGKPREKFETVEDMMTFLGY